MNKTHQFLLLLAWTASPLAILNAGGDPPAIIPDAERAIAAAAGLEGPAESSGIGDVKVLATLPLAGEFEGLEGHVMRVREITLLPGGRVAVHEHHSRPGVAYMLEGEAVEHRRNEKTPLVRRRGDVAMEKSGIAHWWENVSDQPARVVVVDIVLEDQD